MKRNGIQRILPQVPLWAQRSKLEVADARRWCITFAQTAQQLQQQGNHGMVTEIVQFALRTCVTVRTATTFFHLLQEAALSGGQPFTDQDVAKAELQCFAALTGRGLARPLASQRPTGDSSGEEGGDEDLSGEEAVDSEEPLRATAELLADMGVQLAEDEMAADNAYPANSWDMDVHLLPGQPGFNRRAAAAMRRANVGVRRRPAAAADMRWTCTGCDEQNRVARERCNNCTVAKPVGQVMDDVCPPLQPHQEIVEFLVHPKSPISKLLVDHPTGSGKTREMIRVLDNYFYDPRPKIPIFPKAAVCRNFYIELLRWPSRYRDYFCCERPEDGAIACGQPRWQERRHDAWDMNRLPETEVRRLCFSCRDVLEMKGQSFRGVMRRSFRISFREKHPGEPMPLAPLRAISYASAGGGFSVISGAQPLSAVMKIGFKGSESNNVYSHKVVLMDETHNLVRTQTQYMKQLSRLRELLPHACDLVLVGFTGTPILSVPAEGDQLLNIIKGDQTRTNEEGFLSSFSSRPRHLFPTPLPQGIPDGILSVQRQRQLVQKVELHDETLNAYDRKRERGVLGQRLSAYCNVCSFVSSFHDGKSGNKARLLANPNGCCPKLVAVAEAVASSSTKALVMTGRSSGYVVMLELLRQVAARSQPPFRVATMEDLSSFNHVSNLHGQAFRVLVADSAQCSEGVSFLAVRRQFLTDVPQLHSSFVQVCGRSIRMYGHRGLPEKEQEVVIQLYVSTLPAWMRTPLGAWAFRAQRRHWAGKAAEIQGKILLQKLEAAGIRTLAQLKVEIDALGSTVSGGTMASERVKSFLARVGLEEKGGEVEDSADGESSRHNSSSLKQAMRALGSAPSAEDVSLALSSSTADEDALKELARQSCELAPALASMRAWAVDKEIVDYLASSFARTSDCPIWSRSRASMPDRSISFAPGSSSDMSTSIVLHDAITPMLRRRMRNKTSVQDDIFIVAEAEQGEKQEFMVPLADASYNCEATQFGTERNNFKKSDSRSPKTVPVTMQSITKKRKIVETDREIIEVASVVIKRVRTK